MQGSVRKKGATWSYRIELGMAAGKRNQVERSGFKTKSEATKAMNEVIYHYNMTGDFVENKKITFKEVYNEFIEKEAPATRAYATVVRYKSLYRNHLQKPFDIYYMYQITPKMIDDFINEKMMSYSVNYSQVSRHKKAFFRGAGYFVCSQYKASASLGVSILSVPCWSFCVVIPFNIFKNR